MKKLFFYPRANAPAGLGFAFCRRRRRRDFLNSSSQLSAQCACMEEGPKTV